MAVGDVKIPPITVSAGEAVYPDDHSIRTALEQLAGLVVFLPTRSLAEQAGNARAHNVVLLGVLSVLLAQTSEKPWRTAIAAGVPARHIELNLLAFSLGRTFAHDHILLTTG